MIVNYNGKDVKLPDFLIVGAAKSGTTSLYYYLKQHPRIFLPKVKELCFFRFMDSPKADKKFVSKFDDYAAYFKDAVAGQVAGEVCPFYMYSYADTIRNIKRGYGAKCKALKIMFILREPAERAWSHFMMNRKDGYEDSENLMDAVRPDVLAERLSGEHRAGYDYIGLGMYYEQVKAFMDEFPECRVFLYDELSSNGVKVVKEMFSFLGVDDGFSPNMEERYNISGIAKSSFLNRLVERQYPLKGIVRRIIPHEIRQKIKQSVSRRNIERQEMPGHVRQELTRKYYEDDIRKLEKLINWNLSAWVETV